MTRCHPLRRGQSSPWINGLFVIVAALIGGVFTWMSQRPAPSPSPVPDEKTIDQLLAESPVSLTAWQAMSSVVYNSEQDRKRVFEGYLGKRVTWQGYVRHVVALQNDPTPTNAQLLVLYDSRMTLDKAESAMASRDRLPPPCVRCFFPETSERKLALLSPGQRVVVRGTLADRLLTGSTLCTDLRQCEVLFAEDLQTARALGAAPR